MSARERPEAVDRLRAMSRSPYGPEPPRRSLLVESIVRIARSGRGTGSRTPHLFGGDDREKVAWEYGQGQAFFDSLSPFSGIELLDGKEVLDAGCGWGGKAVWYARNSHLSSIAGFDLPGVYDPEVSRAFARDLGVRNCFFDTGVAERMPYPDGRFDLVLLEDVLEHVSDPGVVLGECARVLRPGGLAVVKFPSFRMMYAHHLDRALRLPALHYLLPMRTWAAGLNHLLLTSGGTLGYEPFDEVAPTPFHRAITRNLNGLHFSAFREIAGACPLETEVLEMVPFRGAVGKRSLKRSLYGILYRFGLLREFLSEFVLYIGRKRGLASGGGGGV